MFEFDYQLKGALNVILGEPFIRPRQVPAFELKPLLS